MWHLGQEATLVTSLNTRWTDGDPHCSVIVYGGGREGLPGLPPLLLPAPFIQVNLNFQWQVGPHSLSVGSCWVAPLFSPDPIDPDVDSRDTDQLPWALLAEGKWIMFPCRQHSLNFSPCFSLAHCPREADTTYMLLILPKLIRGNSWRITLEIFQKTLPKAEASVANFSLSSSV